MSGENLRKLSPVMADNNTSDWKYSLFDEDGNWKIEQKAVEGLKNSSRALYESVESMRQSVIASKKAAAAEQASATDAECTQGGLCNEGSGNYAYVNDNVTLHVTSNVTDCIAHNGQDLVGDSATAPVEMGFNRCGGRFEGAVNPVGMLDEAEYKDFTEKMEKFNAPAVDSDVEKIAAAVEKKAVTVGDVPACAKGLLAAGGGGLEAHGRMGRLNLSDNIDDLIVPHETTPANPRRPFAEPSSEVERIVDEATLCTDPKTGERLYGRGDKGLRLDDLYNHELLKELEGDKDEYNAFTVCFKREVNHANAILKSYSGIIDKDKLIDLCEVDIAQRDVMGCAECAPLVKVLVNPSPRTIARVVVAELCRRVALEWRNTVLSKSGYNRLMKMFVEVAAQQLAGGIWWDDGVTCISYPNGWTDGVGGQSK